MYRPPPPFAAPRRRELPLRIKAVLGMKACGSFGAIALSAVLLFAFSDRSKWPEEMTVERAHTFANYAMLATAASLAELLGVVGTWNFKRWGVYLLAGCAMFGGMFRILGGDLIGAVLSVSATAFVGLVVATRWSDFE